MIRFIPTFMDDVRMVRAGAADEGIDARFWVGAPVGGGARMALMPVLFRALRSSENLGLAAEMKGVTGRLTPKPLSARLGETLHARRACVFRDRRDGRGVADVGRLDGAGEWRCRGDHHDDEP